MKISIKLPKLLKKSYKSILSSGTYSPFDLQAGLNQLNEALKADNKQLSASLVYFDKADEAFIEPDITIGDEKTVNLVLIAENFFSNIEGSLEKEDVQSFLASLSSELESKPTVSQEAADIDREGMHYVLPSFMPDNSDDYTFSDSKDDLVESTEAEAVELNEQTAPIVEAPVTEVNEPVSVPENTTHSEIEVAFDRSDIDLAYEKELEKITLKRNELIKKREVEAKKEAERLRKQAEQAELKAEKQAIKLENRQAFKAKWEKKLSHLANRKAFPVAILVCSALLIGSIGISQTLKNNDSNTSNAKQEVLASVVVDQQDKSTKTETKYSVDDDSEKIISEYEKAPADYDNNSKELKAVALSYLKTNQIDKAQALITEKKVTADWLPKTIEKIEIVNQVLTNKTDELNTMKSNNSNDVDKMLSLVDEIYNLKIKQSNLISAVS